MRSTRQASGHSPRSTARHARSAARRRSCARCGRSVSASGPGCTPARWKWKAIASTASRSTSPPASRARPRPARCSCLKPSPTSSPAPGSSSLSAAAGRSPASPANGACWRSSTPIVARPYPATNTAGSCRRTPAWSLAPATRSSDARASSSASRTRCTRPRPGTARRCSSAVTRGSGRPGSRPSSRRAPVPAASRSSSGAASISSARSCRTSRSPTRFARACRASRGWTGSRRARSCSVFEETLALLDRLAAGAPVLLVLEDLHWADPSTLDLVVFLAHNLDERRVLLLATYRADELASAERLRRLADGVRRSGVGAVARARSARARGADGAARGARRRLAAAGAGGGDRRALGGQSVLRRGAARRRGRRGGELPRGLRDLLLQRMARLDRSTQGRAAAGGGRRARRRLPAAARRGGAAGARRARGAAPGRRARRPRRRPGDGQLPLPPRAPRRGDLRDAASRRARGAARAARRGARARRAARGRGGARAALGGGRPRRGGARRVGRGGTRGGGRLRPRRGARPPGAGARAVGRRAGRGRARAGSTSPSSAPGPPSWPSRRVRRRAPSSSVGRPSRSSATATRCARRSCTSASAATCSLRATATPASRRVERAVELVPPEPPSPERAQVLAALGHALMLAWRHEESRAICEQALALARAVGAREGRVPGARRARSRPRLPRPRRRGTRSNSGRPCGSPRRAAAQRTWFARTCWLTDVADDARTATGVGATGGRRRLDALRRYGIEHGTLVCQPGRGAGRDRRVGRSRTRQRRRAPREHCQLAASRRSSTAPNSRSAAATSMPRGRTSKPRSPPCAGTSAARPPYDVVVAELALWERPLDGRRDGRARRPGAGAGPRRRPDPRPALRAGAARTGGAGGARTRTPRRRRPPRTAGRARKLLAAARRAATEAAAVTPNAAGWRALAEAEYERARGRARPAAWSRLRPRGSGSERPPLAAYCRWRQAEALVAGGATRADATVPLREAHAVAARIGARPLLRELEQLAERARLDLTSPNAQLRHA